MTRVCIVGKQSVELRYELLSRETARDALSSYALEAPFTNAIAVETISLGAAVALLNDLDWYLVRFAADAFVMEPSVTDTEWLSAALAREIRDSEIDPADTATNLKIYGLDAGELVEPMYAVRTNGVPEYDLREVEGTVVIRVTPEEFGG